MAVEALFNESYDTLLKRARIKTASDDQTVALVNMSISEVRVGFYKALGAARIAQIKATALVENPETDNQILRASAANTEALWLTYLLLPRLPVNFMAAGHLVNMQFNEEPLTRDSESLKKYLDALKAQIDSGIADLLPEGEEYKSSTTRAESVGPDEDSLIFDSFPGYVGGSW